MLKLYLDSGDAVECEELRITDHGSIDRISRLAEFPLKTAHITEYEGRVFLVMDMKIPRSLRNCVEDSKVFEVKQIHI